MMRDALKPGDRPRLQQMSRHADAVRLLEDGGFEIRHVGHWLQTFEDRYDQFVALVGEEVARVWRLYLTGGGLAFEQGRMGVDQILSRRPARG
jgi:cyclopropane-fatty-acyl-phospholipid synthase